MESLPTANQAAVEIAPQFHSEAQYLPSLTWTQQLGVVLEETWFVHT